MRTVPLLPLSPGALLVGALSLSASLGGAAAAAPPGAERFACLAAAYPEAVKGLRQDPATGRPAVELRDGTTLPWDDAVGGKSLEQRLAAPDLEDMLATPYPLGPPAPPGTDDDPGRVRVDAFFEKLYGKSEREARAALEEVAWAGSGKRVLFNGRQGAAAALRRVSADLLKLPAPLRRYFTVTAGTFNRRPIAGTTRPSAHSYGIAIDINVEHSDYWRWQERRGAAIPYRNRIPLEIVRAFERHGFIWGGRWYHYDTMHFEYRPELLQPPCLRPTPVAKEPT
jgi:hypothetical protein